MSNAWTRDKAELLLRKLGIAINANDGRCAVIEDTLIEAMNLALWAIDQTGDRGAQTLEDRLADWHLRKYGDRPVDVWRTLAKALEEMGEVARALLKNDRANALEECADVAITLTHLVRGLSGSLRSEMEAKTRVIEERLAKREAEVPG